MFPNWTVQFCTDFRKVNAISKFNTYPIPSVDELLEQLRPEKYLRTTDLTKKYWEIPLSPSLQEKTAFYIPFGHFQFKTIPFNFLGAAMTFQRLMNRILRPHHQYAVAYTDSIIVYSPTWEDHLLHLKAMLKALWNAGLTANPVKCKLAINDVAYLDTA